MAHACPIFDAKEQLHFIMEYRNTQGTVQFLTKVLKNDRVRKRKCCYVNIVNVCAPHTSIHSRWVGCSATFAWALTYVAMVACVLSLPAAMKYELY